ncbi:MAG TPA: 3-oxoadipate enol-lactonase [Chloroflexota bacterium]|nr:3-oxoadipate enol-lactonase [Chloroflexota bacterium]
MNFTAVNQTTLHYLSEGNADGLPLVFINSLGTDLRIWDGLSPHFTDRHRVIRYDKRGHGLSDCPPAPYSIRDHATDLAGLLEQLAVRRAVLVGISVGGMIALDFAATWPERVQALVLSDTGARIGTAVMWNERITTLRQHGMAALSQAILARWFAPTFATDNPAAYRGYANMLTRMPVTGYTATCEAIRDADLTDAARTITAPALVLCGVEDLATPPDLVRGLCDHIPHAIYREIPHAAHLPCVEQPGVMAAHITQFLGSARF